MIREATESDFDAITKLASEFWQHTMFDDEFCCESVYNMVSTCHENELLFVAEVDQEIVGFAAGIVGALLGNGAVKVGTELAWWLNPEHRGGSIGIKLLKAIESKAQLLGVKYWNMAFMCSSMPDEVERIYQKLGYTKAEVVYTRRLN